MKTLRSTILFVTLLFLTGCTASVQHISKVNVRYEEMGKNNTVVPSSHIEEMVAPYKAELDAKMNEVIAEVSTELVKKQPEGTLGNWVADAMQWAGNMDGLQSDLSIANYGGQRVPVITPGPLTMGEMYELSPFDNMLLIVDVPGNILDSLFQLIASRGGWPVSANIRMTISNKMMTSCLINGMPIEPQKTYKVNMPDYVANGGDDARFLIPLSRIQTGKMQRDVMIAYARNTKQSGLQIISNMEGRITGQ